jgi:peptide/nickel transport system permease protein
MNKPSPIPVKPNANEATTGSENAAGMQNWSLARAVLHKPLALICGGFLLLVILGAIFAPLVAPYPPNVLDLPNALSGPTAKHLLGSDELGRDILSRLLYGGRLVFPGVLEGVLTALILAVPIGILAGYFGGIFDRLVGAITDALLSIPTIILVLVVLAIFPKNTHAAMIAFGILVSPNLIRIVRGETLPLKEADFVSAARVAGVSDLQIMIRHIRPGIIRIVIVQGSFIAAGALGYMVALGYLGLTASSGEPEWGQMVASAGALLNRQPWLLVPTGGLIGLIVLAFTLFGNALRDASAETIAAAPGPASRGSSPLKIPAQPQGNLPDPSNKLLSLNDLSVAFSSRSGDLLAVDNISFDVNPSEIVGLVGESGAGKSITSLAILRLLPNAARIVNGQILFEGRNITGMNDSEFDRLRGSSFGLVSQEPLSSLDPAFTVGSQLGELVRLHDGVNRKESRSRCLDLLNQVRIRKPVQVLTMYPHELSGGMAQRVAIAMALAGRPKLLIADEPTSALDVTVQNEILALLRQLQQETRMAVLIVTHNFGIVADLCDRVIVLYAGQIFEEANVFQLFDRPANPYTKGLLLANPSNAQPDQPLPIIPGRVPSIGSWPTHCRFAQRCPYAADECLAGPIPLLAFESERKSRCIRVDVLQKEGIL